MLDRVQLSMYDDILIDIVKRIEPGVWDVVNSEFVEPFNTWTETEAGKRHQRLSRAWVKYLAHSLETEF